MKPNRLLLLSALLIISLTSLAQSQFAVSLRNGQIVPEPNVRQAVLDSFNKTAARHHNKAFLMLQFQQLPTEADRKNLKSQGISLLEYVGSNAYTATVSGAMNAAALQRAKVRSVINVAPQQKMHSYFVKGQTPSWAVKVPGTVDVWISFPETFSVQEVSSQLAALNITVLSLVYPDGRILGLRISQNRLTELAALPFVEYVQAAPPEAQPLNNNSRVASGANFLSAPVSSGGKALNGKGVVVGIGDNSDIQTHVDFQERLINRSVNNASGHGQHVSGTLAGAGNINELYRGYASEATIVSQAYSGIISNAATYVQDYGMVITNNSYGNIIECDYNGTYDMTAQYMDQMAFYLPNLTNVFAAGNSGLSVCAPFAQGFRTVLGGFQSAKNVLTVGATTDSGLIAGFSSRGPVKDGRTKPEIVTMGANVISTWPANTYSNNNGTSMAAPAASGGLALLYQRYRELNGGTDPNNGLMKAVLCNGASDRGNAGPDYQYGFGWMNLLRSVDMLEKKSYVEDELTQGQIHTVNISIPASTAELKVMLYWNDPAASLLSAKTLVNDLDLQVTDASSNLHLPIILDTAVARVNNAATTGADHLNNMEQVVIKNPALGNYSLRVEGTAIAQNPTQPYFLVYDVIPAQLKLTAPAGGAALVPGTVEKIRWDAHGITGSLTLEYSADNGSNWNTIATGIDPARTLYSWKIPATATEKALVKITAVSGESSTSNPFDILGQPTVTLGVTQCEGYVNTSWTAVAGATDYELMILRGETMQHVAFTTNTSYAFSGLSKDSVYWVTVRARISDQVGRRAVAVSRQPNSGNCSGSISDNDLKMDAILSPVSGRRFTSTQLSAASVVSVRIKNLDDAPQTNFLVQFKIDNGSWISESVNTSIAAGGTFTYNFATTADLSAAGTYQLTAVVKNTTTDIVAANDTIVTTIKNIDNQPLNLATVFTDDFEAAATTTYQGNITGLNGIDRYDVSRTTVFGRARTFVNSGIAYSGIKALTLDADRVLGTGNINYLYGTYNLNSYTTANDNVRLDFQFLNHDQVYHDANKLWIRGNDTAPWIEAYDLDDKQGAAGNYAKTESIELSSLLAGAGQDFSSSFQVRWGQFGQQSATERGYAAGYTFDDIRIYQVSNDLQLKAIVAPISASCGLTNASLITISVRNSSNTVLNNVPVKYRINNGTWVSESIASVNGNETVSYNFSATADLSAFQSYLIEAMVDFDEDSFKENDSASVLVRNAPVISAFPYLQNFETNNGNWFAEGKNSSWEYGTPVSSKIKGAASGSKAWKTRLLGSYNDQEYSYLYSPCFNTSTMTNPTLSFSMALDVEMCSGTLCDGVWLEYSPDGIQWIKLGASGSGTNWYNIAADQVWSQQDNTNWHVATTSLPTGIHQLHLRFVFSSDPAVNREGVAIDDIHIYDNTKGIYDGATMTNAITQSLSGGNWIDFTEGGKLVASIQPSAQDMGATEVQGYIFNGPVRNDFNQYYHNRNVTVKPTNKSVSSPVKLRLYFLESETNLLLQATGCTGCTKPASPYELGVSKYSDPDPTFENGTIADNQQGSWTFIPPADVTIVPFDKGYYAEFEVQDFSEFWLNNGGFDRSTPLPVKLVQFQAQKTADKNVLVTWQTASEENVLRYEIQVAQGNDQLQVGQFVKVGEVASLGNSATRRDYQFTDATSEKLGPLYFRLKIVDSDGSVAYSAVRSVVFEQAALWVVYPNPSEGDFSLVYQANALETIRADVFDARGRLLKVYNLTGNGFYQKLPINLSGKQYATGMYLLQVKMAGKTRSFKLYKK